MIPILFANMFGLPPWMMVVMALVGMYLFASNQTTKTPGTTRRRIMALPGEPQPPTQAEAFAALDVLVQRMAETGVPAVERNRLHDEIVPKLLTPKEA